MWDHKFTMLFLVYAGLKGYEHSRHNNYKFTISLYNNIHLTSNKLFDKFLFVCNEFLIVHIIANFENHVGLSAFATTCAQVIF